MSGKFTLKATWPCKIFVALNNPMVTFTRPRMVSLWSECEECLGARSPHGIAWFRVPIGTTLRKSWSKKQKHHFFSELMSLGRFSVCNFRCRATTPCYMAASKPGRARWDASCHVKCQPHALGGQVADAKRDQARA